MNNTEKPHVPLIQSTPMITSYNTLDQCHNQDIDIDTDKLHNVSIITTSHTHSPSVPTLFLFPSHY